ncbi:type III-A CRISPR-associated protein Cas10/Csm1 [Chromatium okenii]|uniref:type III-A CRISPR-associated protein Cas10/Csm1 n=1 Tax=Chromatium okenii TaxID=61644 RepID=UPI0026EB987F|nr:type III-A CRISPR-associated protein Cas10/Csm1 [Chromatium okenii]
MTHDNLLAGSCRMALGALLHDVGKFAERAGLEIDPEILATHLQLYARRQEAGGRQWYMHRHAAYTALAIDRLEPWLPRLVGTDMTPFAAWKDVNADDSLINAAARHHKPETFLQWIIATADRVALGFERETFDKYNDAEDTTTKARLNHINARQLTLFEQIDLRDDAPRQSTLTKRYPLLPLSPLNLFPISTEQAETADQSKAIAEYRALWDAFVQAIADIPASHRARLDLWLDHFETLWLTFTHAIPSATAFGAKPEVSLYDHSKAVAALAVALWRYHQERNDDTATVATAQLRRSDWDDQKLLLIQGDLFGIQEFIFASGGETQRRAAKLLRGRSFYVGLLTECAAMRVLDALALPPTSQIINAAGKFLIVAPNTEATLTTLATVRADLDAWCLEHSFGQSGVGLAWLPATCNDFLSDRDQPNAHGRFRELMKRLFAQLEQAKAQRFGLCATNSPASLFDGFLDQFDNTRGACQIDGRSPAVTDIEEGGKKIQVGRLAKDQIDLGNWLTRFERLLVSRDRILHETLAIDLFGYRIGFTGNADDSGRFGPEVHKGNLLRAWDFSLPDEDGTRPLWNGYARRAINAYVPRFVGHEAEDVWLREKYQRCEPDETFDPAPREPKTFNHLASEDLTLDDRHQWVGIRALTTLKGDVDNLGLIFQQGLEAPTFAKMAALSRQMNAFFALYLPWRCRTRFPNAYTVFAGGDDFFLLGPWQTQMELARDLRTEFTRYVAGNQGIHFSGGLSLTKPGLPVRHLAELGEQALDAAKTSRPEKDSVTCFGQTVPWTTFDALDAAGGELSRLTGELDLSTSYLYGLLELIDKAERIHERPENAIWHSQFAYRTVRMLESAPGLRGKDKNDERRRLLQQLAQVIAQQGIERFGGAYRIPLFTHLYQTRD